MAVRILSLLAILVTAAASGMAQQACSAVEVPVGVISASGDTFRGLAAEDFLASKGSSVKSLAYDDSPRRVLLVVDTSEKLPSNAHLAAAELVKGIVAASRPEDSLALITARGPGGEIKFGEDRSLFSSVLVEGSSHSKQGVLDALMEGMEWFAGSKPGDAVVLIAADLDGNHKTNAKAVAKAVAARHMRLFGLALGPVVVENTVASKFITSTNSQGGLGYATPMTGELITQDGDLNFFPLVTNSGGLLLTVVNTSTSKGALNMNDPQTQERVRYKAQQIFGMIKVFYRAQVESHGLSHPQNWTLDLSDSIRKGQPPMFLLYPHELGPC